MKSLDSWAGRTFEHLEELSSPEFQRDQWILGKNQNVVASFDECVIGLLDDRQFEGFVEAGYQAGRLDAPKKSELLEFARRLRSFAEEKWDEPDTMRVDKRVLADPQWPEIVGQAARARDTIARAFPEAPFRKLEW